MVTQMHEFMVQSLTIHYPPLYVGKNEPLLFEVAGDKRVIQGKQKVSGHYFASLIPKPKNIRFYFFPINTHPDKCDWISPEMRKCLKDKNCFHFKTLDKGLQDELLQMINEGVKTYIQDEMI
jgi:hypothetical protein